VFRCNYHGWAYGAEGRLVGAPELDDVERYHLHGTRLTPVRVATYGPLLFVHLGADGPR
jgi:phenylpropionate dioxygenase-like ring-hydroxylating dioxygenase large terminal subunit